MGWVVAVEGVLLAVALVFVVALLRSHAEILRRLAMLERTGAGAGPAIEPQPLPIEAAAVQGPTLAGPPARIELGPGAPETLLAFLSSGCSGCQEFWSELGAGSFAGLAERIVVVAHDREAESIARLRELADDRQQVVLSSQAWRDYVIPGSPHFVLVDGSRARVIGHGTAQSVGQLRSMVEQARADQAAAEPAPSSPASSSSTRGRAAQAAEALRAAGIEQGHPSLHSHAVVPGGRDD